MSDRYAVIDTETNWYNELMSVGIVIASDEIHEMIDSLYVIIEEAAALGGMYSQVLLVRGQKPLVTDREDAIVAIREFLKTHGVEKIFAYNAAFDAKCLPELGDYLWHDIIRIAAYKQYNSAIPDSVVCCKSGRIKSGYKVEDILHMFGEKGYKEVHNALTDAMDELRIMKHLDRSVIEYPPL
ncbi:MAG TPA: hypothetical protein DEO82_00085 [Eubacterium sp.]|nr:hypothetical protein [Eubacterium sp.]